MKTRKNNRQDKQARRMSKKNEQENRTRKYTTKIYNQHDGFQK